jgi:predicted DNA-binding protein
MQTDTRKETRLNIYIKKRTQERLNNLAEIMGHTRSAMVTALINEAYERHRGLISETE